MLFRFCTIVLCLCAFPALVLAVSDDFIIRTQVGEDTAPPTTPTLLSAIPVAATQIDLAWTAATDDFQLEGYTITRDGQHLATTTLTSFSDTGLSASTTYTYFVRAFDSVYNFSSSSNALATTTFAAPITPTSTATSTLGSGTASGRITLAGGLTITPDFTSALFEWGTNRPSRFALRWGRTASYELGFVTTDRYREQHATTIGDLTPGTTYEYELIAFNAANDIPQVLQRGQFTTVAPVVHTVPQNVTGLTATVHGDQVTLAWKNPLATVPYQVRVLRNHLGYPLDLHDGMVIYQGGGETVVDLTALAQHEEQFYTVYVVGVDGSVSSGALVRARRNQTTIPTTPTPGTPPDTTPLLPLPDDIILPLLAPQDIILTQDGKNRTFADTSILLSAKAPLTITIPADALPRHVKSIIVTLVDPTNHQQSYTFLLRLNAERTAYETTLAPLAVEGVSQLLIEVYDFEEGVVGRYGKQITFIMYSDNGTRVVFPDMLFTWPWLPTLLWLFVVLFFCFVLFLLWRRRTQCSSKSTT